MPFRGVQRLQLAWVGGKETGNQPKSCFNCPFLYVNQKRCQIHGPDLVIDAVTKDGQLYTPVCVYQVGGTPVGCEDSEVIYNAYLEGEGEFETKADQTGLEWAKGPGTNCGGFAGGAPCKHFVVTDDKGIDGICDLMEKNDNKVDWDDCSNGHEGEHITWREAQELLSAETKKTLVTLTKTVGGSTPEEESMKPTFKKFIPFAKVDVAKREVWGIVTAEVPDKEDEVCDYAGSKPFYEAVIAEMAKATDGKNFFPLREMHQLSAAGKCVGFEFRDADKEIFMGFKVVDDEAWKKVDEGVYTGFSQGGVLVGDLAPDPVYKGCKRYTANPSEVSLVDNPCLGVAHFAYVKSDGAVELRKFKKTEDAAVVPLTRLQGLIDAVEELKKAKSAAPAKPALDAAVKKLLVEVRVPIRKWVNGKVRVAKFFPSELARLDNDLGYLTRTKPLAKGLYTVGRLAEYIEGLAYMLCGICQEEEWEGEDSAVPKLLSENVSGLLDTFLAYAEEEAEELRAEVTSRV